MLMQATRIKSSELLKNKTQSHEMRSSMEKMGSKYNWNIICIHEILKE